MAFLIVCGLVVAPIIGGLVWGAIKYPARRYRSRHDFSTRCPSNSYVSSGSGLSGL